MYMYFITDDSSTRQSRGTPNPTQTLCAVPAPIEIIPGLSGGGVSSTPPGSALYFALSSNSNVSFRLASFQSQTPVSSFLSPCLFLRVAGVQEGWSCISCLTFSNRGGCTYEGCFSSAVSCLSPSLFLSFLRSQRTQRRVGSCPPIVGTPRPGSSVPRPPRGGSEGPFWKSAEKQSKEESRRLQRCRIIYNRWFYLNPSITFSPFVTFAATPLVRPMPPTIALGSGDRHLPAPHAPPTTPPSPLPYHFGRKGGSV